MNKARVYFCSGRSVVRSSSMPIVLVQKSMDRCGAPPANDAFAGGEV